MKFKNLTWLLASHAIWRTGSRVWVSLYNGDALVALEFLRILLQVNSLRQDLCQFLQTVRFFLFDATISDFLQALRQVQVVAPSTWAGTAVVNRWLMAEVRYLLFNLANFLDGMSSPFWCGSGIHFLERCPDLVTWICTLMTVVDLLWRGLH